MKTKHKENIGLAMIIVGIIITIKGSGYIKSSVPIFSGMVITTLGFIVCNVVASQTKKAEEKKQNKHKWSNEVPHNAKVIECEGRETYLWKELSLLKLCATNSSSTWKENILINDIVSYNIIGDAYTNVTGGGSSIKGAVAGAVIAGNTGAVVGSRKEVKSERVDNRKTVLTYKEMGKVKTMFFSPNTYEILLKLIPQKDINQVTINQTKKEVSATKAVDITNTSKNDEIPNKIRELAKLKEEGILTENEFNEKKKMLLEKM